MKIKNILNRIKWTLQKKFRGWSDDETWDLFYSIARTNLPVLRRLRAEHLGYPGHLTNKKWNEILDKIIYSFSVITGDIFLMDEKRQKKVQEGCELFGKYFQDLWD